MEFKIEDYINERLSQYDFASKGEELFIDAKTGEVISISKGVDTKLLVELVNEIDNKYLGKFINTYILYKLKESDGFTAYYVLDIIIRDPRNFTLILKRIGRNFSTSITTCEKQSRRGIFKSTNENELAQLFNWHKTNLAKYEDKYLYIFRNEIGRIKIGQAINVEQRMLAIKMQSGLEIELIHKIYGAAHLERKLHKKYDEYRYIGEWFNLPENEIQYLKNINLQTV